MKWRASMSQRLSAFDRGKAYREQAFRDALTAIYTNYRENIDENRAFWRFGQHNKTRSVLVWLLTKKGLDIFYAPDDPGAKNDSLAKPRNTWKLYGVSKTWDAARTVIYDLSTYWPSVMTLADAYDLPQNTLGST